MVNSNDICSVLYTSIIFLITFVGLIYSVPLLEISEDFSSFPLCVAVDVQGGLERFATPLMTVTSDTAISKSFVCLKTFLVSDFILHCSLVDIDFEFLTSAFIVNQTLYDSLSELNGSASEGVELLLNNSISPYEFFMDFPIEEGFFSCQLLVIIDDNVIESTEVFGLSVMAQNMVDVFNSSNSSVEFVLIPIFDNDGV